jgi:hypothetical protein
MDGKNASSLSIKGGLELIEHLWKEIEFYNQDLVDHKFADLVRVRDLLIVSVHRLAFLEMVVKGLSHMEQHDAQAYAKFVDSKRKIEDLDIEEFRVLLR